MQREKASAWEIGDCEFADPALDPPDEPPHAAASRARPAMAMMATVHRAARVLSFNMLRPASQPFLCWP
jgi:hypothetical protein